MSRQPARLPGVPWLAAATDPDGELLERFAARREEAAFAALVARYGPMVLGVCRRLLRDAGRAEDAFQATFLILARKAGTVGRAGPLAGWLHAVAHRVAANVRRSERRRPQAALADEPPSPHPDPSAEAAGREVRAAVEHEIARLPAAYRLPIVLCCLEGLSQEDAARKLGCTPGALRGRLERGRARLHDRLARGGVVVPAVLAAAGVARAAVAPGRVAAVASAAVLFAERRDVPDAVASAAAVALAERSIQVSTLKKLVFPAVLLLAAGVLVPVGVLAGGAGPAPAPTAADDKPAAGKNDMTDLEPGIYTYRYDGEGKRVRRADGAEVVLGPRVGRGFGAASLTSISNDNSQFTLHLTRAGPITGRPDDGWRAVVIDGLVLGVWGNSGPNDDGTINLSMNVPGAAAKKVAEALKVEPRPRKHPGHRIETRWTPEKGAFAVGEPVVLRLEIKNTGEVPIAFMNGGKQRGPRNNQFRFLAYRGSGHGKAVPDTGDPTNFGGIAGQVTLKPGETFTATVAIDKWFTFTDPDTYRVTGMFELGLQARPEERVFGEVVWDDLAVGDCLVTIVPKAK
jgi:RNA polymerase sigma factor (sigma-70 family)